MLSDPVAYIVLSVVIALLIGLPSWAFRSIRASLEELKNDIKENANKSSGEIEKLRERQAAQETAIELNRQAIADTRKLKEEDHGRLFEALERLSSQVAEIARTLAIHGDRFKDR